MQATNLAVWFPTIRANTGTDVFTERLAIGLQKIGIRTEITWLPHRSEYAPWTVTRPTAPAWATLAHVNTCMHSRFMPTHIPVVATLHHAIHAPSERRYKSIAQSIYHRLWIAPNERRILHMASSAVAVSDHVASTCKKKLKDVFMHTVYNGIDTNVFQPRRKRTRHTPRFRLLYIGSWTRRKGVDLLPSIMRELGDGFELHYTGDDSNSAIERSIPSNMRNVGRFHNAEQVVAALHAADALILPTRSEGFGLVAAEASACGLPVIATRTASIPEVIEDGVSGLLCPPDDVLAFASAARRLASDPSLAAAMSDAGIKKVVKSFTQEAMLQSYLQIYSSLVSSGNKNEVQ